MRVYIYDLFAGILSELCVPNDNILSGFNLLMRNLKRVDLGEDEDSAALVRFSWNSSNFKRYDSCKFKVVANLHDDQKRRNRGIFISIRRLNIRKDVNSDKCVDYIRFKFGDTKSKKFCGQLNASDDDVTKIYFGEGNGEVEVDIDLEKLQPLKHIDDTLDVEVMFTANEGKWPNRLNHMQTLMSIPIADCGPSDLIRCYDNTCISNKLLNDGINNCPPPYCRDEEGRCPKPPIVVTAKEPTNNNTDIVISALTSLIFTLVGVGSCLWLCWHIKDCFLPEQDSQGRSNVNGSSGHRRSNTRSTAFNTPGDNFTSAAPSTHNSSRPSGQQTDDKDDNPPSYETLFPHLANTNENK